MAACCSALAALARLQAEKSIFPVQHSGRVLGKNKSTLDSMSVENTYLILFRLLRKPKLCEACEAFYLQLSQKTF
jgi:hypothetical protein